MKESIVCCLLVLLAYAAPVYAQNKQIKMYIQQIAANQVYIEYLQKGYQIAKQGLTTIGNIKNGHFSLDKDFFAALESINPRIRNYSKVAAIIALQEDIRRQSKMVLQQQQQSGLFPVEEQTYVQSVITTLLMGSEDLVQALKTVLSPHRLKMSDNERIGQIDKLYTAMQERKVFCVDFSDGLRIMALQRAKESSDARRLSKIYGLGH